MRRPGVILAICAAVACPPAGFARADNPADAASVFGVWRNPKNSVHVEIRPCAAGACGYVVWANAKARADALKGGTAELVGLQLFRDMRPKDGVWRGRVFVPDLNRTFGGTAEPIDGGILRARGCVLGAIFCKTQTWTRIDPASD